MSSMRLYNPSPEERRAREARQDALMDEIMREGRAISWSPTPLPECFVRATYYKCLHVNERKMARSDVCPRCPPDAAVFRDANAQGCDPPCRFRDILDFPCPDCETNWNPVRPGTEEMRLFEKDTPINYADGTADVEDTYPVSAGNGDQGGEGVDGGPTGMTRRRQSHERLRPEEGDHANQNGV